MKFKDFLIDAAMNPSVFKDVEKRIGDIAKVGFEFEFLVRTDSPLNEGLEDGELLDGDWNEPTDEGSVARNVAYELGQKLFVDVNFHMEPGETDKEPGIWYVEPDSSISGEGVGLEIVSPPLKLTDALKFLPRVCKFMSDNDFETNDSTGFHINVSVPNIVPKLDKTKLILFMGEKYAAKAFRREANAYTKSQLSYMLRNVMIAGRIPNSFDKMLLTATKNINLGDKYVSVNFKHLYDGGAYLEFRIAGGKNYHERITTLQNTILRFVRAVELACDPRAERNEYAKKLSKFFNTAQSELIGNDTETLFARFKKPSGTVFTAIKQYEALDKQLKDFGQDFWLTQKIIHFIDMLFIAESDKNILLSELETAALRKLVNGAKITGVNIDAYYSTLPIGSLDATARKGKFKKIFKL